MVKFELRNNQFVIENYDKTKPFASFLPSVAGTDGIPMWVYYVNRGQGIAGFGVEDKDNPILDFVPANLAYRRTELNGFRTFIKVNGIVYESFSSTSYCSVKRKMAIDINSLSVIEENYTLNLKITVKYFNVAHDNYPGLVRKVSFASLDGSDVSIEVLDGLTTLWPAGVNNHNAKNMSNLSVAWFDVLNVENKIPYFKNRATTADTASVGAVEKGHFYLSVNQNNEKLDIIYDHDLVFDQNTSLTSATFFEVHALNDILAKEQISVNKIPCAFTAFNTSVNKESYTFYSLVGRMDQVYTLNKIAKRFNYHYFVQKEKDALELGIDLTKPVNCKTALPIFDAYVKQSFVDNLLRGGYPLVFEGKEGDIIYHVYSRIHGDMEREYNHFYLEPAYFSQGNGNFRDVNQNRRNDVYFVKEAGLYNIKQFMELIQLDGHNPLVIKGSSLILDENKLDEILSFVINSKEDIKEILSHKFTPGKLLTYISVNTVKLSISQDEFLKQVLKYSIQEIEAVYGEGYWIDHWTYNMDLIDQYLNIYPDNLESLLFDERYRFFESHMTIRPRTDKYVLTKDKKVRQLEALQYDHEKIKRLGLNPQETNWSKDKNGNVYQTSLYVKLLSLALNKVAGLDPFGMGVMMDADKPGWNDSMNGLPGIFGSGVSETVETRRITQFLLKIIKQFNHTIHIPIEIYQFLDAITNLITLEKNDLVYFDKAQNIRETYREEVRFGLSGQELPINFEEIVLKIKALDGKIDRGIKKANEYGKGMLPTYFTYEATQYELLDKKHPTLGLPNVKVIEWNCKALPFYLEAPARYLKQVDDVEESKAIYKKIRESQMYDDKLQMYITSESLENETLEIGRARAFTPGWLEREACFMHMEYKYLSALLKTGLYTEFFEDIKTCLPPFMDPEVYGRSILENSSFIASSRNPNPYNHGRGFVARLTGTTAEMISMWIMMMMGKQLFIIKNDELIFSLNPILNEAFFDEDNQIQFRLLNTCEVTYQNEKRKNTYGVDGVSPKQYTLIYHDNTKVTINDTVVKGKYAQDIRCGKVVSLRVNLQ